MLRLHRRCLDDIISLPQLSGPIFRAETILSAFVVPKLILLFTSECPTLFYYLCNNQTRVCTHLTSLHHLGQSPAVLTAKIVRLFLLFRTFRSNIFLRWNFHFGLFYLRHLGRFSKSNFLARTNRRNLKKILIMFCWWGFHSWAFPIAGGSW